MTVSEKPRASLPTRGVASEPDEISIWSYLNVLLRRWYLVVGLPIVAGLLAGTVSLMSPREYVAQASFVPQQSGATQTGFGELATRFGLAVPTARTSSPQFYTDLLQSRSVMREVVLTPFETAGGEEFEANLIEFFGINAADRDEAIIRAIRRLRTILTVNADRVGVVRLRVHTTIPELSVEIVSRFLELINDYNLEWRQSQARAERIFVEQRVAMAEVALRDAEQALSGFYRANRRFADSPQLLFEEGRLQRQVNFRQQLYLTVAQRHEAAKIEEVRDTPVITVVERPEGFVEPKARGTVGKAIIGFFVGAFLALVIVFGSEYVLKARRSGAEDYQEFIRLRRGLIGGLRARLLRLNRR